MPLDPDEVELVREAKELKEEITRLKAELQHFQIKQDVDFWRTYADATCKELSNAHSRAVAALSETRRENEGLKAELAEAKDNLIHLDNACWYCANPDIEDPWRHEHEPNGGHWHHRIDPGDGLASDCANSDRLERIFQDVREENAALKASLESAREALRQIAIFKCDPNSVSGNRAKAIAEKALASREQELQQKKSRSEPPGLQTNEISADGKHPYSSREKEHNG